jgi:hypothetical protein
MSVGIRALAIAVASLIGAAWAVGGNAADFTVDAKTNADLAKKLNIPVYYAVPASARIDLPKDIKTTDKLVDFRHPDDAGANGDVGLRLIIAKRSGLAKRLAQSGLVQTGDILLSFRTEWGGAGAYPNIQLGISHTGVAYVKDGYVHNIDNPLSEEYLGRGYRADLTSEHYSTLNFIHIIRPRNLTDTERANIIKWATRLNTLAPKVYPSQLAFNQNYSDPKYSPHSSLGFVQHLGQIALGQSPAGKLDLYCSEFAWSLLSLRDCDPDKTADQFKGSRVPSCVKAPMQPMEATGNAVPRAGRSSRSGLADGPLITIYAMGLPDDKRKALLHSIFIENPKGLEKMSVGHRELAKEMQPQFAKLESYYTGITGRFWQSWWAKAEAAGFNNFAGIKDNYSPTSYLINTLLPKNNKNRTMDYVATVMIE